MTQPFTPSPVESFRAVGRDLGLVLGLGVLLLASGIGLRDPWPADEPRFVLIARDLVEGGNWLFPHVGGDYYQDKPPLYLWLLAAAYALTGSVRWSFLLPSLLAGLGTLVLVYDLTRRLWNRQAGLWAALVLLFTVQFTDHARTAQMDMTLCFFVTLAIYSLLRHLLLRDGWMWYALGGFAAGLGVLTKGVGFLALLLLLPYAYGRWRNWPLPRLEGTWFQWSSAPIALVAAITFWLVPMLVAASMSGDPALEAYRDELLFQQTVSRYAAAWHHHRPFFYFLGVMLTLWLPLVALLPWLVPRWIERLRERDARLLLLLSWIVIVLLFFTVSAGKRDVYILPALPALAVVSGEWLRGLWQRPDVQRAGAVLGLFIVLACAAAFIYVAWIAPDRLEALRAQYGVRNALPLLAIAVLGSIALIVCGVRRGALACAWVFGFGWLVVSFILYPQINEARSGKVLVAQLEKLVHPGRELGLLAYPEQFLLYLDQPSVNFGHRRWREGDLESYDAARWLNERPDRQLLIPENLAAPCFTGVRERVEVGISARDYWLLVSGPASADCAARGKPENVISYSPPVP
ncbi:MAG TPA: glycosyltransferase family 39 protein [Steroidobacteraceae bacterium]|nr:glycosyltransferase family 39 protein [Steroidobacteraceae bacterium]